jgi:hypothetical protein
MGLYEIIGNPQYQFDVQHWNVPQEHDAAGGDDGSPNIQVGLEYDYIEAKKRISDGIHPSQPH